MTHSSTLMMEYHVYLIEFSRPFINSTTTTAQRTSSSSSVSSSHDHDQKLEISTFCILSKQKLHVPEFVVDRRRDVITTAKLIPIGSVVTIDNSAEWEEMLQFHNFFVNDLASKSEWKFSYEQIRLSILNDHHHHHSESLSKQKRSKIQLIDESKHMIILPVLVPIREIEHVKEFMRKRTESSTLYFDHRDIHTVFSSIVATSNNNNKDLKCVPMSFESLKQKIHLREAYIRPYGSSLYDLIEQELKQYKEWFPMGSKQIRETLRKYNSRINVLQTMETDEEFRNAVEVSEKISEKFRSSVVLTTYNFLPYNIDTVDFYSHVNDPMIKQQSFYSYYTEKRKLTLNHMDQPMLTVVHTHEGAGDKKPWEEEGVSPTIYYLQKTYNETYEENESENVLANQSEQQTSDGDHTMMGEEAAIPVTKLKKSSRPMLIPEFCAFSHLPDHISTYAKYATICLEYIEEVLKHYARTIELEARLQYTFTNKLLLRNALTHKSFSSEKEVPMTNNERLEFLGDSVLEIIVSHFLFEKFKVASEGVLTQYRTKYVKNIFLESVANDIKTVDFLLYPASQYQLREEALRVGADTLEALIGAVFLDGGMKKAVNLCNNLILTGAEEELKDLPEYEEHEYHSFEIPFQQMVRLSPQQEQLVNKVEGLLGVRFENPYILVQALTHKSYKDKDVVLPNSTYVFNYERLEFLGDCILKFIVGSWLFLNYPSASESKMTMARHNTVDNLVSLAGASKRLGLSNLIRHNIPPNLLQPDSTLHRHLSSDVFEAILGAIYLDRGGLFLVKDIANNKREFDVHKAFVHRHLIDNRKSEVNPNIILQPLKNKLQEVLQSMLTCAALPSYQQLECITLEGKQYFNMAACLSDLRLAIGEGMSRKEAEIDAARKAIRLVEAIQTDWEDKGIREKQSYAKLKEAVTVGISRDPDLFTTNIEEVKREGLKSFNNYLFEVYPSTLTNVIESSSNPLVQEELMKKHLLSQL